MYFTTQGMANYYDCDCNNRLKISSAMKYMQQTSSEQLKYLGISPEKLMAEDMVFLLSKMCIKVHRMPTCAEELTIGTAPATPRGVRFVREFIIDSAAGERLLSGFSLWVLVDPKTRKIMRPQSFPYAIPFQPSRLTEIIDDIDLPRKIDSEGSAVLHIPIRYSHVDCNSHVNNTVYADFVCDILPHDELLRRGINTLAISFQNEARWGDTVDITSTLLSTGEYYIYGLHGGSPCFAAVVSMGDNG